MKHANNAERSVVGPKKHKVVFEASHGDCAQASQGRFPEFQFTSCKWKLRKLDKRFSDRLQKPIGGSNVMLANVDCRPNCVGTCRNAHRDFEAHGE